MIYVGQPGSGTSTATLKTRIILNHINGSRRGSTFRRTIAAILKAAPSRDPVAAPITEAQITAWIRNHLSVRHGRVR